MDAVDWDIIWPAIGIDSLGDIVLERRVDSSSGSRGSIVLDWLLDVKVLEDTEKSLTSSLPAPETLPTTTGAAVTATDGIAVVVVVQWKTLPVLSFIAVVELCIRSDTDGMRVSCTIEGVTMVLGSKELDGIEETETGIMFVLVELVADRKAGNPSPVADTTDEAAVVGGVILYPVLVLLVHTDTVAENGSGSIEVWADDTATEAVVLDIIEDTEIEEAVVDVTIEDDETREPGATVLEVVDRDVAGIGKPNDITG